MVSRKNKVIIIAAPSGAGKTSITRHLLNSLSGELAFSISAATRQPEIMKRMPLIIISFLSANSGNG
jgi:guanylate kinase